MATSPHTKPTPSLLVIDDEPNMAWLFTQSLGSEYRVTGARSGPDGLKTLQAQGADLVLLDLCMPGMDGVAVLREIKRQWPTLPVVMITAYATVQTAVEAIKAGAADYITKPFDLEEIRRKLARLLPAAAPAGPPIPAGMVAQSPEMVEIFRKISRVGPTDASVLITGETGTGKELVARAVHAASRRAAKPFVAINCAALPESLLESELFGHEKGAFTGAQARKPGRFELAHGGTLLLDEVGDMPLSLQAKLLRVLENRMVEPLGSTHGIPVDLRVLSSTHRDLREMAKSGAFREDLYFRLAVVPLHLKPLRERTADIAPLALHMLRSFAEKNGKAFHGFSPEALAALTAYAWPGNVRELRNLIEQVVVLWDGYTVELDYLPEPLGHAGRPSEALPASSLKSQVNRLKTDFEHERILGALRECAGNRTQAARLLGISRRALQLKLKAMNV